MASDLRTLAQRLLTNGATNIEATPRRIRILFNRQYAFDSKWSKNSAQFVWEHKYFPYYYLPLDAINSSAALEKTHIADAGGLRAYQAKLTLGDKATDRLLVFEGQGVLGGLVRFEHAAADAWFEEDAELFGGHPRDPYKRIDILPSSKHIRVQLGDIVLAESDACLFLYESMLPVRYYMPKVAVNWNFLKPTDTVTECPYKGKAQYYTVEIDGKAFPDYVWWYEQPTHESAFIAGRVCFYNEKVDIYIDGVLQDRPSTKFS